MNSEAEPAHGEKGSVTLAVINTLVTGSSGRLDHILDEPALESWLRAHGLVSEPLRSTFRAEFAALRASTRALLSAIEAGSSVPTRDLDRLNDAAAAPVRAHLTTCRELQLEPASGSSPIAGLALEIIRFLVSADAERTRTCAAEDCDRMFLQDHRRRIWCSSRCGARMRTRRHAARLTADSAGR